MNKQIVTIIAISSSVACANPRWESLPVSICSEYDVAQVINAYNEQVGFNVFVERCDENDVDVVFAEMPPMRPGLAHVESVAGRITSAHVTVSDDLSKGLIADIVVAHELGHVLLGPDHHDQGLMSATPGLIHGIVDDYTASIIAERYK
jgi:hypothetical protein